MKIYLIIALIVILLILIISFIVTYNRFVRLRTAVNEAFATMDVYLKRRYDLVPNLVAIVKQYSGYEQQTLEKVMLARQNAMSASGTTARSQGEGQLTNALRSLWAVAENYPALKADGQYLNLQNELSHLEADIATARKYYNGVLRNYNSSIQVFPANLTALMFGFRPYPYFEITAEERENVQIRF